MAINLKSLFTRKKVLKEELEDLQHKKNVLSREEALKIQELNKVNRKLLRAQDGDIIVTEHAMLRYMERVKYLNIDEVKKLVLPDETRKLIEKFGSGKFPAGTHHVLVKNKIITTIII